MEGRRAGTKRRTLAPNFHCQARRHLTIPFLTLCITDGLGTDSARPWSPGGWCMARQELAETALSPSGFMHWRGRWQPTPVFLPGESQGWGILALAWKIPWTVEPGRLQSMGSQRVRCD